MRWNERPQLGAQATLVTEYAVPCSSSSFDEANPLPPAARFVAPDREPLRPKELDMPLLNELELVASSARSVCNRRCEEDWMI